MDEFIARNFTTMSSLVLVVLIFAWSTVNAQSSSCQDGRFSFEGMGNVTYCKKLAALRAELGWNYHKRNRDKVDIFFGAKLHEETGWVAWGVNPGPRPEMVGTRALIAFRDPNGTLVLKSYNITDDTKRGCHLRPSSIDVEFKQRRLNYASETGFLSMFVTLTLARYDLSRLNIVWQIGSHVEGDEPQMHGKTIQNFDSCETINLASGAANTADHLRRRLRKVHGVLCMIGWGSLLPVGIIIARYFKIFPVKFGKWFGFHVGCQLLAFTVGTIGWAIGISLGNSSKTYICTTHRIIGIVIFSVAMLQMLALWLRPHRNDEFRKYWHIYHHFLGYGLFALVVVNIFQGINILQVENWRWAYVGILCGLGLLVLSLEFFTWAKFLYLKHPFKDPKRSNPPETPQVPQ